MATAKTFKSAGPPASRTAYAATDTFLKGELVVAAEGEFVVEDAAKASGTGGQARVAPTRVEALKARGTRAFTALRRAVPQELKSDEHLALEATPDRTRCFQWDPAVTFQMDELACDFTANKMYPTFSAEWAPFVDPDNGATGQPTVKVAAGTGTIGPHPVWTKGSAPSGATTGSDKVDTAVEAVTARDVRTTPQWKAGQRYRKYDAAAHANATWECRTPKSCGTLAPGEAASAAVWVAPVLAAGEAAVQTANGMTGTFDAAAPPSLKKYAEAWASGYETYQTAYKAGSLAAADDGTIWECAPEAITGVRTEAEDLVQTPAMATILGGSKSFDVLAGCAANAPATAAGAGFWRKSGVAAAAVTPPGIVAQPWAATEAYAAGELAVAAASVWRCKDATACATASPATAAGAGAWAKTPFPTAKLTGYDATGATRKPAKWVAAPTGGASHASTGYAYVAGESQKAATGGKCYVCLDALKCRSATHAVASAAGVTAGAWLETTGALAATGTVAGGDRVRARPAGCQAADELKAAALPPARRVVAAKYAAATSYATGAWVAAADAQTSGAVWACAATAGCPTASGVTAPAAPTWRLLRAKAAATCVLKAGNAVAGDKLLCSAITHAQNDANGTACGAVETSAAGTAKICDYTAANAVTAVVKKSAYRWSAGTNYKWEDRVLVGETVYKCGAKATVELCASTDPTKDLTTRSQSTGAVTSSKGGVWQATDEQGTDAGAPAGVAVDAIPLRELLKGTKALGSGAGAKNDGPLALRKGQHFQLEGRVYKCALPAKCATALFALKTAVDQADAAEKKPLPAKFDSKGKRAPPAYRPKANLLAALRTHLGVDDADPTKRAFAATYNTAKKGPRAWGALPLGDPAALAARSDTLVCDLSGTGDTAAVGNGWLKGDVFCDAAYQAASLTASSPDADMGGAWTCVKPLLCGDATMAPNKAATNAAATHATTGAWAKVAGAGAKAVWAAKPDRRQFTDGTKATLKETKAFDWADVTGASATGTFAFAAGDLASEQATAPTGSSITMPRRIYKCAGSAAACAATKPSSDADGKTWQLTTLKGAVFTAAEKAARQPVVRACFLWEQGYPFAKNDEVCDPARPAAASWTCLDALKCSAAGKPGLERQAELAAVWNLATTAFRVEAGTGRQTAAVATFKTTAKPKEDAPVQCSDYDDLAPGADVSAKGLLWCDQGRVYACKETATATSATVSGSVVVTKTYPCCSTGGRPSNDTTGCWALTRSRGSVQKLGKAAADLAAGLPAPMAAGRCLPGPALNLPGQSSLGVNAAYLSTLTEGVVKLEAGRACTDDAAWKLRQAGAWVKPSGPLGPARATWPRNVKVIDQSFDGRTLDAVFAGAGYKDGRDRRWLLSVLAWFPGVCGPQPAKDLRDSKAACRAEFLGLLTFALAGETRTAAAYQAERTDDDVAWWQQAFAERAADAAGQACWKAEVAQRESVTGASGPAAGCKMHLSHNGATAAV